MKNNKKIIQYLFDRKADILYFSVRKPSIKDISQEIDDDIVDGIDAETKKLSVLLF
jgi:uncharacterized protein YuzE